MNKNPIKLSPLPAPRVEIINLIDVLMTLVAFFMLTTVFAQEQSRLRIDLPQAKQAEVIRQSASKIVIEVRRDGKIMVDRRTISIPELQMLLKRISSDPVVIIRADQKCHYQIMIRLLDLLKENGLSKISFEVRKI